MRMEVIRKMTDLLPLKVYPRKSTGSVCSKLTTSLVNETLKFQTLNFKYANIFCAVQKLLSFFNRKYRCTVELQWLEHLWDHEN